MLKQLRNREDFEQKNLLQKGFTLVELLVVIVILGILAAVVVFAVSGSTSDAKDSACKAENSSIASAVEAYRAKTGNYPTMAQLTATGTANQFLRTTPKLYGLATPADGTLTLTTAGTAQGCALTY